MNKNAPFHIYINAHSGTVQAAGQEALETQIRASALPVAELVFLPPEAIFERLAAYDGAFPLLIGGGDGTIRSCGALMRGKGHGFGILPLGTMNLLARDLGLPETLEAVLQAYAEGATVNDIDVGVVNDEIFLCCAGIGMIPEASQFREENRGTNKAILIPQVTAYALKKLDPANRKRLWLTLDHKKFHVRTPALVVSNNTYGPQEEWSAVNFIRKSLQDGIIGVYALTPSSLWDKIRLALRMRLGNWRNDKALQEWQGKKLRIEGQTRHILVSLDGEPQQMDMPLTFEIDPRALKLSVPEAKGPLAL